MRRRDGEQQLAAQARTPLGVVFPTVSAGGLRGAARSEERSGGGSRRGGRKTRRADRGASAGRDEVRPIRPRRGRSDRAAIPARVPHGVGIVDRRRGLRADRHWGACAYPARGSALARVATARTTHRRLRRARKGSADSSLRAVESSAGIHALTAGQAALSDGGAGCLQDGTGLQPR